jgi:hypothetical protein
MKRLTFIGATLVILPVAQAHDAAADMSGAAAHLLSALDDTQRARARFAFDSDERLNWHFIPRERKGLPLKDMTPTQRHLAYALLGSGLSSDGFAKAATVMSLEQILRDMERAPDRRDPEKYYFTVFGDPAADKRWAWRCEGHHCSVNFTVVDGRIAGTPSFFGANPGVVRDGARQNLQALREEEEAGRALVRILTDEQKSKAVLPGEVPRDILSEARKQAEKLDPPGLSAGVLNADQRKLLRTIVEIYVGRARPEVAAAELAEIDKAGFDSVHFVWSGGTEPGQPHYYRVQGPTFLLEYDNTQNNANHPHSVWRDFKGDFGKDLLAIHLGHAHGIQIAASRPTGIPTASDRAR